MTIIFKDTVKHGRHQFIPGVALAFEDERAEEYFQKAFGAEETNNPPQLTYPVGSVEIDPETVFASTGKKVLDNG